VAGPGSTDDHDPRPWCRRRGGRGVRCSPAHPRNRQPGNRRKPGLDTFDSRDPYAQAAQQLAQEHPLLKGVVETTTSRINAVDPNIFSLSGVYDGLKRFDLGMVLPRGRSPKTMDVPELVATGTRLFDLIDSARPEFQRVRPRRLRRPPRRTRPRR